MDAIEFSELVKVAIHRLPLKFAEQFYQAKTTPLQEKAAETAPEGSTS